MGLIVVIAAILSLAAVIAAAVFVVLRTLELWRGFQAFSGAVGDALDDVAAKGERVAESTATLGERTAALEPALARLAVSRARLQVLLAAWADVRGVVAGVTGLRPQK